MNRLSIIVCLLFAVGCGPVANATVDVVHNVPRFKTGAEVVNKWGPPCEVTNLGGGRELWLYCNTGKEVDGKLVMDCVLGCTERYELEVLNGLVVGWTGP